MYYELLYVWLVFQNYLVKFIHIIAFLVHLFFLLNSFPLREYTSVYLTSFLVNGNLDVIHVLVNTLVYISFGTGHIFISVTHVLPRGRLTEFLVVWIFSFGRYCQNSLPSGYSSLSPHLSIQV